MSIPAVEVEGWLRLTIAVKELRLNLCGDGASEDG
jgi:hypothetical protein